MYSNKNNCFLPVPKQYTVIKEKNRNKNKIRISCTPKSSCTPYLNTYNQGETTVPIHNVQRRLVVQVGTPASTLELSKPGIHIWPQWGPYTASSPVEDHLSPLELSAKPGTNHLALEETIHRISHPVEELLSPLGTISKTIFNTSPSSAPTPCSW